MVTYLTRLAPVYNFQSILGDEYFQITCYTIPDSTTFVPAFRLNKTTLGPKAFFEYTIGIVLPVCFIKTIYIVTSFCQPLRNSYIATDT